MFYTGRAMKKENYEKMTSAELDKEAARLANEGRRGLQAWKRSGLGGRDWSIGREQTIKNLLKDDEEQAKKGKK